MLGSIWKKEMVLQFRTARFFVVVAAALILGVLSGLVMGRDYDLRQENYEVLSTEEGWIAQRAPQPLSMLVRGLDERIGSAVTVGFDGRLHIGSAQSSVNRLFSLFNVLDLHFIVAVVLSLGAVLFSYDAISGEKRDATLKMIVLQPVSRSTILFAKALAAWTTVLLALAALFLTVLLTAGLTHPQLLSSGNLGKALLLYLFSALYLGLFITTGLLVSALTWRPAVSLLISMLVWAVLVFALPPLLGSLARDVSGGKSRAQFYKEEVRDWGADVFKGLNMGDSESLPGDAHMDPIFRELAAKHARRYQEYLREEEQRVETARAFAFVSPVSLYHFGAWALAGTGPTDATAYKRETIRYQAVAYEQRRERARRQRENSDVAMTDVRIPFSERGRDYTAVLSTEILPLASGLGIILVGLFYAAAVRFSRYDVR